MTTRQEFVLDTNILIHDPASIQRFQEHDVIVPMTVLEELDKIKDSPKTNHQRISQDARAAIQQLQRVINGHGHEALEAGLSIGEGLGALRIINDYVNGEEESLPHSIPDNRIISCALSLQKTSDSRGVCTVLVTKDINMQIKAKVAGLEHVQDYRNDQVVDDLDYLSKGYIDVSPDWRSNAGNVHHVSSSHGRTQFEMQRNDIPKEYESSLWPNAYWVSDDHSAVWRVVDITPEKIIFEEYAYDQLMNRSAFGIKPRNIQQALGLHALMDPSISLVVLNGAAGSGKTLLALAAAFEQSRVGESKHQYEKIVFTRNTDDMTDSIGFLPGTEEEKMKPWLGAVDDSMEVLMGVTDQDGDSSFTHEQKNSTTQHIIERSGLQFKSTNFMRGRSYNNTLLILDESQNLTNQQVKSCLTRCGQGSKMILLGNLSQIDNNFVTPQSSGLTHAVHKMRPFEGSTHVTLQGVVRSPLADFAEKNL